MNYLKRFHLTGSETIEDGLNGGAARDCCWVLNRSSMLKTIQEDI
ncbi:MAG: hypothetical protein ACJA1Z_000691 [Patiriisocius sp.]|jgi:hypothetical protein